jgi:hypothetical protein
MLLSGDEAFEPGVGNRVFARVFWNEFWKGLEHVSCSEALTRVFWRCALECARFCLRSTPALRAATTVLAAGRISSIVARKSSQYTATAAAPAITVAMASIAQFTRIHMTAFSSYFGCAGWYGTVRAI